MGKENRIDCCMKRMVFYGHPSMTVKEAALIMADHNIGTLPVVDETSLLVGVTTIQDVIHIFLPDFVDLLTDINFIKDYGEFESPTPENIERAESLLVTDIMEEPIFVEDDCTLIRALSYMEKHSIKDLPVVKEGKLVGIASQVDIGRAFLSIWLTDRDG